MTVLVGYLPDKGGRAALDLGLQLAAATGRPLVVATVVPRQWATPSLARIDAEYADYARRVGEDAERRGREYLDKTAPRVPVTFRSITGRSVPSALVDAAVELEAGFLILGSSADGPLGLVVVGSTSSRLLHSSPVAVALSPRGYRTAPEHTVTRVTCAFSDTPASVDVVRAAGEFAAHAAVPLRVVTFGVRGTTMYPSEIGLRAEDSVLRAWTRQARDAQSELVTAGVIGEEVERVVVEGDGWGEAVESIEWEPGELLVVGSSPVSPMVQVFLGSRATKLVRHSPVPVLVMSGIPAKTA
ncbi:MAG: hypothetical protein JWQ43_3230 [Glaciihabitans sp.]|nr:hypothetical protein [Glaciihabitans sp.]